MACDLTTGFTVGCNDASGGIVEFIIGNFETAGVITQDATGVTGIAGLAFAFTYAPEKATSTMSEDIKISRENGTRFYAQKATIVLNKTEQVKRNEIKLLAEALVMIIGKDKQGLYWMMGIISGSRMANSTTEFGTAMGDRNGYNLNFEAEEIEPLIVVDPAIIPAILAP